ncbi:hypothetical protein MTR67_025133, partial [Solanum verrucosum]
SQPRNGTADLTKLAWDILQEPLGVAGLPKEIVKVSAGYHHSSAITVSPNDPTNPFQTDEHPPKLWMENFICGGRTQMVSLALERVIVPMLSHYVLFGFSFNHFHCCCYPKTHASIRGRQVAK